jgi:hypothetical protein
MASFYCFQYNPQESAWSCDPTCYVNYVVIRKYILK